MANKLKIKVKKNKGTAGNQYIIQMRICFIWFTTG